MKEVRSSTLVRRCRACLSLLLGTTLAICLAATRASADPVFKGTFTVTTELHWGRAVLPPGDYTLMLDDSGMAPTITISDTHTNKFMAIELARIESNAHNGDSNLRVIGPRGQRLVYSVRLAGYGEVFHSEAAYEMAGKVSKGTRIEEAVIVQGSQTVGK